MRWLTRIWLLGQEITNDNLLVGLYAIRAIEAIGPKASVDTGRAVKAAVESRYEFTSRVAKRLVKKWDL